MMHTRSSPSHSENDDVAVALETGSKSRCDWSEKDEIQLIDFLIERRAAAGDSATFKAPVWNAASQLLEKSRIKGGPKTNKACSDKWTRVRRTAPDGGTTLTFL
jgi:hypothetical protein